MKLNLELNEFRGAEIIHFASEDWIISSNRNVISVANGNETRKVTLPQNGWKQLLLPFRLARRAARLDKCNVFPNFVGDRLESLIAIRQGFVYQVDYPSGEPVKTLQLTRCRNVLHQSICKTDSGNIFFGEYGNNGERKSVPVYRSTDQGKSWQVIYEFPAKSVKHVHGCYWDQYAKRVWVCTGDFAGENIILSADEDFNDVVQFGDGSQSWRTCYPLFFPDHVIWPMDSQLEISYLCKLDRKTGELSRHQGFPGPVWYAKDLTDGWFILATANEIGEGVTTNSCHVFVSQDALNWQEIFTVPHDGWPKRYFKFGVIGFADGEQSSQGFFLFAEAVKGMDGKSFRCRIVNES